MTASRYAARIAAALIAAAGISAGYGISAAVHEHPAPARTTPASAPPATTAQADAYPSHCMFGAAQCIGTPDAGPAVGQLITDSRASFATPWMVTDYQGAPMAWVNLYGLYSGGDGGKMPGGLLCVTYGTAATVACLTPAGTLQLTPAGPGGRTGPTVTLTARDIRYLHHLERTVK